MDTICRLWILVVALAACGSAAHAEAQSVAWEGSCAREGASLPGEVAALVGRGTEAFGVHARVTGERPFELALVLTRDGASIGERAFAGVDCEELVSAAALVVALAIDPEAAISARPPRETPDVQAPPVVASAPAPLAAALAPPPQRSAALAPPPQRSASAPHPARSASTAESIRRARAGAIAPEPLETRAAAAGDAGAPWHPNVSVGANLVLDVGALPNAAPGIEARIGLAAGPLRLEGAARYHFEQESGLGQHPTGRGHFGLAVGSIGACLPLAYGPVAVGPCLALEAGALWGASTGVSEPGADTTPWVAPTVSGLLAVDVARWLRLRMDLGVAIPLIRSEFIVDGLGPVHAAAPVTFRAALGAEVHFR